MATELRVMVVIVVRVIIWVGKKKNTEVIIVHLSHNHWRKSSFSFQKCKSGS